MLIQCPSCRARAKLSDDHEGAKVRCAECGRVFVARPSGAKGPARSAPNTGLLIGAFVGAVALIVVVFVVKATQSEPAATSAAPVVEAAPSAPVDFGWSSEIVQGVVALHHAAHAVDRERVKSLLHGPRIWEREQTGADGARDPGAPSFAALEGWQRAEALERWAEELVAGPAKDLVADWMPFDGEALEVTDDEATVRLAVKPRGGGIEKRWVDWRLAKDGGRLKAWRWERWISPDEAKAAQRQKGYEKVTLSDGSVVHERQPEPLGHLEDTPPELRSRIDGLVATILDLELTKEGARARRELVEIGRPAVPILLTKFYEIPADTEDNRIRCNIIDQTLQSITGQHFGYAPGEAGSAAGTTEERRQSSIKQWFAWWYKNQDRFVEKRTEDALEGLIELDAKEKAWLERNQDG